MDYARKFNTPAKLDRKMKSPRAIVSDGLMQKDSPIVEDHRLVNWKVWLSRRKKQYRDIEARTGRRSTDQLINSCEEIRPKVEMRNVMECAATSAAVVPDSRGPEFWHVPESLPNRGDPCAPEITVKPTRKDLNLPPELVHVGLPDLIKKEKDLAAATTKKITWRQSAYLRKREEELASEIKRLVPKEPEMDHLVIQGRSFSDRKKRFSRKPPIRDTIPEDEAILQIPEARPEEQLHLKPSSRTLHFISVVNEIAESKIVLQNKGLSTIIGIWRKFDFQISKMPLRTSIITPFYFNKNKIIIPEKKVMEIKVWYLPRSPGLSYESWQLCTKPQVSSAPLVFRFWGCCEKTKVKPGPTKFDPQTVDVCLDRCARDSLIRLIIEEMIESIETSQPPEPAYRSLLLENDIFSSRNPEYFYHPSYVIELRNFHQNIGKENAGTWNLSLDDLRDVILQLNDPDQRLQMLNYLNKQCKELRKPPLYNSDNVSDKHEAVYNLLCGFFNVFETESEYTRNVLTDVYNQVNKLSDPHDSSASAAVYDQMNLAENAVDADVLDAVNSSYREIFAIRISEIFIEVIDRVCAVVDSHHRLNYPEK